MDKQEEFDREVAKLISGLEVPISIGVPLGTADAAWRWLFETLNVSGYASAFEIYNAMLRYRREQGNKVVATAD